MHFRASYKADGIWDALKASCILAGARTLNGALQPLVGPAPTRFNFVAGDYNRVTGLVGDGTTKYLDSNRNNTADPQNSQHIAVNLTSAASGTRILMGVSGAVTNRTSIGVFAEQYNLRSRNSNPVNIGSETIIGFVGKSRSVSTNVVARIGGQSTTYSMTSNVPGSQNIGVFAGGDGQFPSNMRANFYSIGEHLNIAALEARVTTLMSEIGAAI